MNSELLDEAKRLSVIERIELVEAIWDSVAEDAAPEDLPLSDPHRIELDSRLSEWAENPDAGSPWSEVRERLKRRS